MGLKDRRANIKHGQYSRALVLPAKIKKGKESTLAANRLILVDPRGEISEDDLLDFLERFVEPQFWPWVREQNASSNVKEGSHPARSDTSPLPQEGTNPHEKRVHE